MGETKPGGRIDRVPPEFRGAHALHERPEATELVDILTDSLWSQATGSLDNTAPQEIELKDPALFDLPKGASLSTGPYTQDGIYIVGAPEHSAFRFSGTTPRVDGKLISRSGKLWIKQEDGTLIEPPPELQIYGWATTRKTHRLLPKHFNGADSAKSLPNLGKTEEWLLE